MRQKLTELQGEIDKFTIIFEDISTPLLVTGRFSRQKIIKDILELNSTINQLDIIDIYKIFYPTMTEYTVSLHSHEKFTNIDHIFGHKTHLIILLKRHHTMHAIKS